MFFSRSVEMQMISIVYVVVPEPKRVLTIFSNHLLRFPTDITPPKAIPMF